MKKVLVVITTGFVCYGGLTTAFMNYYRTMDKKGLIIDVASIGDADKTLIKEINNDGGCYYKLPSKQKKPARYAFALAKICKGYDVIHVNGNSPTMVLELEIAKICRVKKRIAHSHNTAGMHPVLNIFLMPFFNSSYTLGLSCSKAAGAWIYQKKFHILNNAIDTHKYRYQEKCRERIREKYNLKNDYVIGNVSKFVDAKNHGFIIDVFKSFHDLHANSRLMLVGDGPNREKILKRIKDEKLESDIILIGMVEDASDYYSTMDTFILPSFHEGLCLALLEAQANGLECMVSTSVTKENGICQNVEYIELQKELWKEKLINKYYNQENDNRQKKSEMAILQLINAGYDNYQNSYQLREFYLM